mmetsp:Transcript_23367/g.60087  ORF Transcript_23367/g.60087 Transcript_23367/m.60087 type:complete len:206 (+) Transcript_23367:104-721(+)
MQELLPNRLALLGARTLRCLGQRRGSVRYAANRRRRRRLLIALVHSADRHGMIHVNTCHASELAGGWAGTVVKAQSRKGVPLLAFPPFPSGRTSAANRGLGQYLILFAAGNRDNYWRLKSWFSTITEFDQGGLGFPDPGPESRTQAAVRRSQAGQEPPALQVLHGPITAHIGHLPKRVARPAPAMPVGAVCGGCPASVALPAAAS